ncbi:MAG: hypothetical protein ACKO9H_14175 [Planctomycetota bacterium]
MSKTKSQTKTNAKSAKAPKALNETGKRKESDRRQSTVAVAVDRRKVQRRRQIDPTTCEREYNDLEIEFMHALDEYKRSSGRMFPTCSEILEVLLKLGYRKVENGCVQVNGSMAPVSMDTHLLQAGDNAPLGLS